MKATKSAHARLTEERGPGAVQRERTGITVVPSPCHPHPVQEVAEAHHMLKLLRERIGDHPELLEALTKLEVALSALTVNSGGLL